jgi:hypothetical protein
LSLVDERQILTEEALGDPLVCEAPLVWEPDTREVAVEDTVLQRQTSSYPL